MIFGGFEQMKKITNTYVQYEYSDFISNVAYTEEISHRDPSKVKFKNLLKYIY